MKKTIAAILAGALCLTALTACGGSKTDSAAADNSSAAGDDKTITVGATPTPHAEILNAAKDALEAEGYTLNVVEFTDYVQPNTALVDGDLDANYFQHTPYLNNFNKENGTDLISIQEGTGSTPLGSQVYIDADVSFSSKEYYTDDVKDPHYIPPDKFDPQVDIFDVVGRTLFAQRKNNNIKKIVKLLIRNLIRSLKYER